MKAPASDELIEELLPQVQHNCAVADAAVAGCFSLCGLLLRMRNLYKWERGLPPWKEQETPRMLEWVNRREEQWEGLLDEQPTPLRLDGTTFDPFDAEGLNRLLEPMGLVYGAGRIGGLVPMFFLGRLGRKRRENGLDIYELGGELASDILFMPGMRQGECIYLRSAPFPYLVWDLLADPRPSLVKFKRFGLRAYGLDYAQLLREPGWEALEPILSGEMKAVLWHELGEAGQGRDMDSLLVLAATRHPGSEVEHFVRGVKDLLADSGDGGRLDRIIQARAIGALGLYPVWLSGFLSLLFPEILPAVERFMDDPDWDIIDQTRGQARQKALQAADDLQEILNGYTGAEARTLVRKAVIEPLVGPKGLAPME